ncbi:lysozyme g-like [Myripristis murdjan]|uniref:Lysozyme g n=1 Tax=Myripristis murdjan TaxID=586833 RepID=A0A667Y4E4_9TELE|nr:lysozyme g-like [Myripristis murdjan]
MASRYGDIGSVQTSGASRQTASADRLSSSGVSASHEMAASDLRYVNRYKDKIISASRRHDVQPAIVAGIISRETRGGRAIESTNGYGDHGNAFGLMQVDKRWHSPRGAWDSEEHISQGIEIYTGCYSEIANKLPSWTNNQKLKGALAAYNMGASNVRTYEGMDVGTTGGDYANDVSARAQYYLRNGY